MSKHILVAYDGSPQAEEALTFARTEWPDVEMTLCYVINPADASDGFGSGVPSTGEEWFDEAKRVARERLDAAVEAHGHDLNTRVEVGRPAKTIVEVAREDDAGEPVFDHLVIGSHGRKGVSRILLGSVAETVVRDSPVPVTVVR
jgi:nucleotide-binding universal stress UspA family protein